MRIILLAPPAAGKGTEAQLLEQEYSIPHISTGDLLRNAIQKNNVFSKVIQKTIEKGDFVSDEIVIKLIEERIANDDCKNGYILDGFPRNISQAQKYNEMLDNNLDNLYVFVIDMDKEIAKSRIIGRRSCPKCGRVYNINFKPLTPKKNNLCDDCGIELIKRPDDNVMTLDERYNEYLLKTAPLIDYYKKKSIAYFINGNLNKYYTHDQINKILNNNKVT